jgi:hypothetical protein
MQMRMSTQPPARRCHGKLAVLDALDADQRIRDFLNLRALPLHDQDFQAVAMIEMHVHAREHERVKSVLNGNEFLCQRRYVMIVHERDRPDRLLILIPFLPDQIISDKIPERFRSVRVLLPRNMTVEIIQEMMVERNAEADYFFHNGNT